MKKSVFSALISVVFLSVFGLIFLPYLFPSQNKVIAQSDGEVPGAPPPNPDCTVGCGVDGGGGGVGCIPNARIYYCTNPISGGSQMKQQCSVNSFDSFPTCDNGSTYCNVCPVVADPCTLFPGNSAGSCGGTTVWSPGDLCSYNTQASCNSGSPSNGGYCTWIGGVDGGECIHQVNLCAGTTGEQNCWGQMGDGGAQNCYWYCPNFTFATPTPTPTPIPKTCSVSLSPSSIDTSQSVTVDFSGNNNNHINSGVNSDTVKLWLERADGGAIDSIGSCSVACNSWSGTDSCWYACSAGAPTESRYYLKGYGDSPGITPYSGSVILSGLAAGNYFVHCDLEGDSNTCTGNPNCDYNGGSKVCSSYVSCSPTDHGGFTVNAIPTSTPTPTPTVTPTPTNTPIPTPTLTPTLTPTPTFYQIYGWVNTETDNIVNPPIRTLEGNLLSGYAINITGAPSTNTSTTTIDSAVGGVTGNYLFKPLDLGTYIVSIPITPTGYQLFIEPSTTPGARAYTQSVIVNPTVFFKNGGFDAYVDFPFVTVAPTPSPTPSPSVTPTSTPIPPPPTATPPPGACSGTPSPLPSPELLGPDDNYCTNVKPTFAARVNDTRPTPYNVFAHFTSPEITGTNFDSSKTGGSTNVYPPPGISTWTPDGSVLNISGRYSWSATAMSSCPGTESTPAPAKVLKIDNIPPPKPAPPTCSGPTLAPDGCSCTFDCSWPADPKPTPVVCSDTTSYYASFRTLPSGGWEPGWSSSLNYTVETTNGKILHAKVKARDNVTPAPNQSDYSDDSIGYECPKNDACGLTITPTVTIPPATPTPGDWTRVNDGNVYMDKINMPVPLNKTFLVSTLAAPNSIGVIYSGDGSFVPGNGKLSDRSPDDWKVAGVQTNTNNFTYYWEALKAKATPVNNQIVGFKTDLDTNIQSNAVYSYSGSTLTVDSTFFKGDRTGKGSDVTIFLITGTLNITTDISITGSNVVVFIVNGEIHVLGDVANIAGLFISNKSFTAEFGAGKLTVNGMVYADSFNHLRTYRQAEPAYEFFFDPKYQIALIPYMGRSSANWLEVKP